MKEYVRDHDILGLDVAVRNLLGVEVGDSVENVPELVAGLGLLEHLLLLELLVEGGLLHVLQDQVDALEVVEHPVQLEHVGVLQVQLQLGLHDELLHHVILHDLRLPDLLQRVQAPRLGVPHQVHLPELALPYELDLLELLESHALVPSHHARGQRLFGQAAILLELPQICCRKTPPDLICRARIFCPMLAALGGKYPFGQHWAYWTGGLACASFLPFRLPLVRILSH